MNGMNRTTGHTLSGVDHLRQSIVDILTTPIGSRVMRRDYGSRLYDLVDAPVNRALLVEIYSAVAESLLRWEPRFELNRVQVESISPGTIQLAVEGNYLPENQKMRLEGLML